MCIYYTSPLPLLMDATMVRPSSKHHGWVMLRFISRKEPFGQCVLKTFDTGMFFSLALHESTLVKKWILAHIY
jgi:hypothetical protein